MPERLKIGITIVLLLTVAYIFIIPAFDLDPTALRGVRLATLVFLSIAAAGFILNFAKPVSHSLAFAPVGCDPPIPDITDLTCTRLC